MNSMRPGGGRTAKNWLDSPQVCHLFHHPSMPGETCACALVDRALNVAEVGEALAAKGQQNICPTGSEAPHLPRAERSETLGRNARCGQSVRKCKARRVNRFIGKLESAVVMGEPNFCSTID